MLKPHSLLRDCPPSSGCDSEKMAPPFPSSPAQTLMSVFVIFPCSGSNESASSIPLSHTASVEDPGRHICHAWPARISATFAPNNLITGGSFGACSTSSTCVSSRPIHRPLIEHAELDLYLVTPVFSSSSASSHRRSSFIDPSGPYCGTAFDPTMSPKEPVFVVNLIHLCLLETDTQAVD